MPVSGKFGRGTAGLSEADLEELKRREARGQKREKIARAAKARRKATLEETVRDNIDRVKSGKKAKSMSDREKVAGQKAARAVEPAHRRKVRYQRKVADLRAQATQAEKSGNKKAAATFRKVAENYVGRLAKLQGR